MHALIIEDECLIALEIEQILRDCGFLSIEFAESEGGALTAVASRLPDLITCDVQLNPGSGVRAMESLGKTTNVPVIFVTGSPDEARKRFPNHVVLVKPFSNSALRTEVMIVVDELIERAGSKLLAGWGQAKQGLPDL